MPTQDLILYRLGDSWTSTSQAASSTKLFVGITESDILKIKDKTGFTNLERIFYQYNYGLQEKYRVEFDKAMSQMETDATISWPHNYVVGTLILVPKDKINRAIAARDGGSGQLQRDSNYIPINNAQAFIGDEIRSIVSNSGYTKILIGEHGS